MARTVVQVVDTDGCFSMAGVRVRCAPGNGHGSLHDEAERGVRTPVASEEDRKIILGLISSPRLRRLVEELPAVRAIPRGASQ